MPVSVSGNFRENGVEVWSHTVVAPMAAGRLDSCLQWHIIKGWQIFKKNTGAFKQCGFLKLSDGLFIRTKTAKIVATRRVFWAHNI